MVFFFFLFNVDNLLCQINLHMMNHFICLFIIVINSNLINTFFLQRSVISTGQWSTGHDELNNASKFTPTRALLQISHTREL